MTDKEQGWIHGRPHDRRMAEDHAELETKFSAFLWGCVLLVIAGIVGWAWWTGR